MLLAQRYRLLGLLAHVVTLRVFFPKLSTSLLLILPLCNRGCDMGIQYFKISVVNQRQIHLVFCFCFYHYQKWKGIFHSKSGQLCNH